MITAIIQARMGSSRLPKKIMKRVQGRTLLQMTCDQVRKSKYIDKIIIATTDSERDDATAKLSEKLGFSVFRGSENDVLDRYYRAALFFETEVIVRITADCPLIDPEVIDKVIGEFIERKKKIDYVSNLDPQTYPVGMAVEIFSFKTLRSAWKEARLLEEREHVTLYIRRHPEIFNQANVENNKDLSGIRLTVDTKEDLNLIRRVCQIIGKRRMTLSAIASVFKKYPSLYSINRHVKTEFQKITPV